MKALQSKKFKEIREDKQGFLGLADFIQSSKNNKIQTTNGKHYRIVSIDSPEFAEYQRLKEKRYYEVESDIQKLVSAFNIAGFKTYASCQGHGLIVDKIKPYIAFYANTDKAALFEKILREDSESAHPFLLWGWCITASFNDKYELVFSLTLQKPAKRYFRYLRSTLRHDFEKLTHLLKKI